MNKVLFEFRNQFAHSFLRGLGPLAGCSRQTRRTQLLWAGFGSAMAMAYGFSTRGEDFPLNEERIITTEQVIGLKIGLYGVSENPGFADSLFDCKQGENNTWSVVRRNRPSSSLFTIPLSDGTGQLSIEMVVGAEYLRQALAEKMVIGGCKQVPDFLSAGCIGQVYTITMQDGKKSVLKVYKRQMGARAGERFLPARLGGKAAPLSSDQMIDSLRAGMSTIRNARSLQKSPHYAESYGLVYIEEWNVWTVASEFLEGTHPSNYSLDLALGKKVFASMAEGLKLLDQQGAPFTDLKSDNVLIGNDGMAMFFDDLYTVLRRDVDGQESSESKERFGTFMYDALHSSLDRDFSKRASRCIEPEFSKMKEQFSPEMAELICSCWKQQICWDEIIQTLSYGKRTSD